MGSWYLAQSQATPVKFLAVSTEQAVLAMRVGVAAMIAALLSSATGRAATPAGITAFVHDHHLTRYSVALADLNGDGRPEALIYAMATAESDSGSDLCGSGGCDLNILALSKTGYRQVSSISITRPPIRVLTTVTHGWHDIGVLVGGGGIIPGYEARLRFNGITYPSNPTVLQAIRLRGVAGKVVIGSVPSLPPAADHSVPTFIPHHAMPSR